MGNHRKIVPKKIITTDGKYELKESDIIVKLIPGDENISIKGITPLSLLDQVCAVETFQICKFNKSSVILWQISEGIISHQGVWIFGYDNIDIGNTIYQNMRDEFLDKALEIKKPILVIASPESGELVYREVIISK